MKITFILPGFSRFPVGGFKIVYEYANYLVAHGQDVQIIHAMFLPTQPSPKLIDFSKYKLKQNLLRLNIIKPWFKLDGRVQVINKGKIRVNDIPKADRVIATAWETAEFVDKLPEKCGIKYYFIQHYEIWGGKKRVDKTWKLPLKKIVIATWLKDIATGFGEKAYLVPNFVEHKNFYVTKKIEPRNQVISMLYSEHEVKGSSDGFKALKLAKEKYPDLKIEIFGVFEKPKDLPVGATYYRNPSRRQLNEIYNESAIYLFPSLSEGWGLTATEAMACGAALCSTDNGGVNDFGINGKSALISPVSDPVSLFNHIDMLLSDKHLRIKIAKKGVEITDKLTLENSGKSLMRALDIL
ncbi:glycosyl transferase [Secundilactobacillus pentosiphilus]|uniref:Glycosyl transferase n=1 Tax=Secundilactobacillus pentosiphilus TaxID=1714682 RepID=A0A1Z5IUJ4_9LACO|nr:glycosyltransferase family 4 protein [Secundilactobacillus pentosiphilus]GAX05141.1 glycosyl transferase [Secundilactobacillus pentosiphilus]